MNANVSELIRLLSEKEQEKVKAERLAAEKVKAMQKQVDDAAAESMELQRALAQEAKDAKAQFDKALRLQAFNCKARIHQEIRHQAMAEGDAERQRVRMAKTQDQCYKLSLKIQDLQIHLHQRTEEANNELRTLEHHLEQRIDRVQIQGEQRSNHMKEHALQSSVHLSMQLDTIMKCCKDQMRQIHTRAERHSRYKELCQLAETRDTYTMSRENYRKLKAISSMKSVELLVATLI
eukprot:symbB.v1.2.001698.t1/scaffold93.1/size335462/13